ncbi:metalloproteinase inhibitor 2 [Agelaius tricolor]|uniref:metalloproteinase inhibitor 2 n=1 Tax=Agelaius tricolor TaxID=9191 RepID=UPI0039F1E3F4
MRGAGAAGGARGGGRAGAGAAVAAEPHPAEGGRSRAGPAPRGGGAADPRSTLKSEAERGGEEANGSAKATERRPQSARPGRTQVPGGGSAGPGGGCGIGAGWPRPQPRTMPAALPSLLAWLAVLLLGRAHPADACSCSPIHPQQAFCNADVVIRAKAVSAKEVDSGNDIYGNPIKRIQYEIKQIKMFKGPDQDIEFIYTAPSTAVCGRLLDTGGKKEYLIAGKSEGNGKMHITLCDLVSTWDSLTPTQKKSLNQRYQMGCECKISRCLSIPCFVSSSDECLWTDWAMEKNNVDGRQAKHYACIKRSDGSCAWYRGMAPPKQEFLDIEDP